MTGLYSVLGVLLFYAVYHSIKTWLDERREREEEDEETEEQQTERTADDKQPNMETQKDDTETPMTASDNPRTRDFFLETLRKMGCKYSIEEEKEEEEDKAIYFSFQGENFTVYAINESLMVNVWDFHWYQQDVYDLEALSRLKRAINNVNINCHVNIVYCIDKEIGKLSLHSHQQLLFIQEIPHIEDYLQARLYEFFRAHRELAVELEKLKLNENAK